MSANAELIAEFRKHPRPFPNVTIDLVELEFFYALRIYASEWDEMDESHKQILAAWVSEVMPKLNQVAAVRLERV